MDNERWDWPFGRQHIARSTRPYHAVATKYRQVGISLSTLGDVQLGRVRDASMAQKPCLGCKPSTWLRSKYRGLLSSFMRLDVSSSEPQ
jgi:hypothetical protein